MHAVFAVVTATTYRVTVIGIFSLEDYDGADSVGLVGFCCAGECARIAGTGCEAEGRKVWGAYAGHWVEA